MSDKLLTGILLGALLKAQRVKALIVFGTMALQIINELNKYCTQLYFLYKATFGGNVRKHVAIN